MRRIGQLPDATLAERFTDYLVTQSIEASWEQGDDGCDIWIRDESTVDRARTELAEFRQDPDADRYDAKSEAARIRKQRAEENRRRMKFQRNAGKAMASRSSHGAMMMGGSLRQHTIPVTIAVIALSAIASFATNFGRPEITRDQQTLTTEAKIFFLMSFVDRRDYIQDEDGFASIRRGQIWRLVTPMFLHGSPLHLIFNMLWIYSLGSAIERLHGSFFFVGLLLITHIAGMLLQVLLPEWLPAPLRGTPFAIGASGAVYGLLGFLWIRPSFNPTYPIRLPTSTVVLMLGWLLLCMTPIIPAIANGAHLGGLLCGVLGAAVWPRGTD